MIKKLLMMFVATMAATGFAEIWAPRASEIQFEGVKLPDGTSSGLLVTGSNAVAKVKLEQFSPGWRVFDEEYDLLTVYYLEITEENGEYYAEVVKITNEMPPV